MVVILCDSDRDAKNAFLEYLDILEYYDCTLIKNVYYSSYCIDTDEDLRYVFIYWRFRDLFKDSDPDYIWQGDFFENLRDYYEMTTYMLKDLQDDVLSSFDY